MPKLQKTKRHFAIDGIVVLVIILIIAVFAFWSSRQAPGWEVKKGEEEIEGEEREIAENIIVQDDGHLKIIDSTLTVPSSFDDEFGMYLVGNSELTIEDSRVEGGDGTYFISGEAVDGKSPEMTLTNSTLADISGVYLRNRTKLSARDSELGRLYIQDDAQIDLRDSSAIPIMLSDKAETFEDLAAGEKISKKIESNSGWLLDIKDCDVDHYRFEIVEDDELTIKNSKDFVLSLHTPGDLEEKVSLEVPGENSPNAETTIDNLGFTLKLYRSWPMYTDLHVAGSDKVEFFGWKTGNLYLEEEAVLEARKMELRCESCSALNDSQLTLRDVNVLSSDDFEPVLYISDKAAVTIVDSDIRNLRIIMIEKASLTLENTQYDEEKIENDGDGEVTIVGQE